MKKISYHSIALQYIKENGHKVRSGNWKVITPLLSQISGIPPLPGRGHKASGNAILKKLGFANHKAKKSRAKKEKNKDVNSDAFLSSYAWRKLRMQVLEKYGAQCHCCGRSRADGIIIHIDHIKPRRKYPELALDFDNLQCLCNECNHGKGNWDETDWRD